MQECVSAPIFNAVKLFTGLYDWSKWFFNENVELLSTAIYFLGDFGIMNTFFEYELQEFFEPQFYYISCDGEGLKL